MVFSTNQARQLYVVNKAGVLETKSADGCLYFTYVGADNIERRSDLIPIDSITYKKKTEAAALAIKKKAFKVTLASDALSSGNPIPGDYILKVFFRKYASMSDEGAESRLADVRVTSGTTASQFYAKMAIALAKNFSKEVAPLVDIYVATSANNFATKVGASTKLKDLSGTYTALTIVEAKQDWQRGIYPLETVDFNVVPGLITLAGGAEIPWGNEPEAVATTALGTIKDGKLIADLEYFCLGERGDVYRNVGWPNSIPTDYQVDPSKEYDVIDIHYAYQGTCEDIQKSEKDITIVIDTASEQTSTIWAAITGIVDPAINDKP